MKNVATVRGGIVLSGTSNKKRDFFGHYSIYFTRMEGEKDSRGVEEAGAPFVDLDHSCPAIG